jgi:hypothetical protein
MREQILRRLYEREIYITSPLSIASGRPVASDSDEDEQSAVHSNAQSHSVVASSVCCHEPSDAT